MQARTIRKWSIFRGEMQTKKNPYTDIYGNPMAKEDGKVIGYCHNFSHLGFVTARILKKHQCMQKGCPYLNRYMDKPYWVEKERIKQDKKRKARRLLFQVALQEDDMEKVVDCLWDMIS